MSTAVYDPTGKKQDIFAYTDQKIESHEHSAENITSGVLSVARGGTGLEASPKIRVNLASSSQSTLFQANPFPGVAGVLPIANGGTGGSDATAARTSLGAAPAPIISQTDITAGSTALAAGQSYHVYE